MGAAGPEGLLAPLDRLGMRFDLEAMRRLLAALGNPQRRLPPVVLVGGTNGKGSTAATLAAIATKAGYRTGLYTSPHLEEARERVRIAGRAVSAEELAGAIHETLGVAPASDPPTWFEAMTAAAFLLFARGRLDLAVLEVGLGGRLDATNVVDPALAVVADLGLDHRDILGETLAEIAREKAGILRRGRPAVALPGEAEGRRAMVEAAAEVGADLAWADVDAPLPATPALAGAFQRRNAALATAAARRLAHLGFPGCDDTAIAHGLVACRWPGRMELVELPDGRRVLLDGGHNAEAARALAAALPAGTWDLLFGALADKDAAAMLSAIRPRVGRRTLVPPPTPRALGVDALAALPGAEGAMVEADLVVALDRALASGGDLLVTGSLYLVGAVRPLLRDRFGVPPPAAEMPTVAAQPSGS